MNLKVSILQHCVTAILIGCAVIILLHCNMGCNMGSNAAQAKCLGTHGVTYPIEEIDPVELIQYKLNIMEKSGELRKRNLELQNKARVSVERPKPVEGITRASRARVFYYDPTYEVKEDLYDHQGTCFAKKGTRLNPLKTVSLSTDLIFFDGDDEEQLAWVKKRLAGQRVAQLVVQDLVPQPDESTDKSADSSGGQSADQSAEQLAAQNKQRKSVKLILIKGVPLKLSEELGMPVYFDQSGILTTKLGIRHIPAFVRQEALRLRIEEVDMRDEKSPLQKKDL